MDYIDTAYGKFSMQGHHAMYETKQLPLLKAIVVKDAVPLFHYKHNSIRIHTYNFMMLIFCSNLYKNLTSNSSCSNTYLAMKAGGELLLFKAVNFKFRSCRCPDCSGLAMTPDNKKEISKNSPSC